MGKESEFEKPYLGKDYRSMHLDFPWPSWPISDWDKVTGLGDLAGRPIGDSFFKTQLKGCQLFCVYNKNDCSAPIWCVTSQTVPFGCDAIGLPQSWHVMTEKGVNSGLAHLTILAPHFEELSIFLDETTKDHLLKVGVSGPQGDFPNTDWMELVCCPTNLSRLSDDFAGANGASPDTCLWTKTGTPTLTGTGYLRFNLGDRIVSNYYLEDDYFLSTNFKMNSGAKQDSWAFLLRSDVDASNYWHMSYRAIDLGLGDGPKYYYIAGKRVGGAYTQDVSAGSDTLNTGAQTFTGSRTGKSVTITGGGLSPTFTFPVSAATVTIQIAYTVAAQADVDSFTFTSGKVTWPDGCANCS